MHLAQVRDVVDGHETEGVHDRAEQGASLAVAEMGVAVDGAMRTDHGDGRLGDNAKARTELREGIGDMVALK